MLPSHAAELSAIAFQLLASVEDYEQALADVPVQGPEPELLARLAADFDQMQLQAATLPQLSVSWVALLISRAELMHRLWVPHQNHAPHAGGEFGELLEQHREAVHALRCRAMRLIRKN